MATTTIRVSTATRDRLNALAVELGKQMTTDDVVDTLLDHYWQIKCVEQADQRREEQPDHWREGFLLARDLGMALNPERVA